MQLSQGQLSLRQRVKEAVGNVLVLLSIDVGLLPHLFQHFKVVGLDKIGGIKPQRVQTRATDHRIVPVSCNRRRIGGGTGTQQGHPDTVYVQVPWGRCFCQSRARTGIGNAPLFQVVDGGQYAAAAIVTGVIVGRVVQVKAVAVQIIQDFRLCHGPGAAGYCRRIALLVMNGDLQIIEFYIVPLNDLPQLLKTGIALFRDPPGDEAVTGDNKSRLVRHFSSPLYRQSACPESSQSCRRRHSQRHTSSASHRQRPRPGH